MKTLKIYVSDSIYEHIIFFLKSLPTNLIKISDEDEVFDDSKKQQIKELFKTYRDIKPFKNIDNPIDWQKGIRNEWE